MAEVGNLKPLIAAQLAAVDPHENVWLSASAGTGKTQVLTARVIRLLLDGVPPESLLCITFTKAGAAEMAERIGRRLASWVQMDTPVLAAELLAIGAGHGPDMQDMARQLFARVLDAPGGGLQIMTIHSFCQSLLGSFPEEAGMMPGFRLVEGPEQHQLLREAMAEMILAAEARSDRHLVESLQSLSLAMGEDAARNFLRKCASALDVMALVPEDRGAVVYARRIAGVSFDGTIAEYAEIHLSDAAIDRISIETVAQMNRQWGTATGNKRADKIDAWLALPPAERADAIETLHSCWWSKAKGEPQVSSKGQVPQSDVYVSIATELALWTRQVSAQLICADYADRLAKALLVGKAYATAYTDAKHAQAVVDFDDMIRKAAALLKSDGISEWIRFKLDRRIEHILVDESQDTNAAQWDIVKALSADFFTGLGVGDRGGEKEAKPRTLFSVGDFKQAIYGFQGTAPERYAEAGDHFEERLRETANELQRLGLSQSFRSTAPVLDFVNSVIDIAGHEAFGIDKVIPEHFSEKPAIGQVELFAPVTNAVAEDEASDDDEENWIASEKRLLAEKLATYVKTLIDEKPILSSGQPLLARDIMFLLRSRGELASLLVAQLHERNVPVAGIDRLRLAQPLVVQDLLACIRFVLQPGDDLSLACLLVSPLIGWSQEKLLLHGYRSSGKVTLWQHLREQEAVQQDIEPLRAMLAAADFTTVYHFLEQILSGPTAGRRNFVARLGSECLVPIEEMLNAAIQFEQQQGGGLQHFLDWFDKGDIEIARTGETGANEVRILTVHGAKGLQAPVVILADVTADPEKKPDRSAELLVDEGLRLPLLPIRKAEAEGRLGEISDRQKQREAEEHMRLLYVAITRAEERLVLAGSLGARGKGVAPEASWYPKLELGMQALGHDWVEDPLWGRAMRFAGSAGITGEAEAKVAPATALQIETPYWLFEPAPAEARPPRPLVPSRIDDDDYGDAPASAALGLAAERGKLIHALFERIESHGSMEAATRWLAQQRVEGIDRTELLEQVRSVIVQPNFAAFLGSTARSEVPLAALVGDSVITGRIDRLVVEPDLVRLLDFKTGRHVPRTVDEVPIPHMRQMAHYVAALQVIFPGRKIEASLLFTHAPHIITLPEAALAAYKPASAPT